MSTYPFIPEKVIATGFSPLVVSATTYNPPFDSYFDCRWFIGSNYQINNYFFSTRYTSSCKVYVDWNFRYHYSLTCSRTNDSFQSNLTFSQPLSRGVLNVWVRCFNSDQKNRYSHAYLPAITVSGNQ